MSAVFDYLNGPWENTIILFMLIGWCGIWLSAIGGSIRFHR